MGATRAKYPALTNAHENELFDWLFKNGGYGPGVKQVNNLRELQFKVKNAIAKNTDKDGKFNGRKALNPKQLKTKTVVENQYAKEINAATKAVTDGRYLVTGVATSRTWSRYHSTGVATVERGLLPLNGGRYR